MRQHAVAIVGAITIVAICSLELFFTDFFIALDYRLVTTICVLLSISFFFVARKSSKTNSRISIGVAIALLVLGFTIGHIPTTPRKKFYVLAKEIRVGESLDSAKLKLRAYESWTTDDAQKNLHSVGFRYIAGPGTADTVVVRFDPKTLRVTDVSYSSD
jgi:hypothetical protein